MTKPDTLLTDEERDALCIAHLRDDNYEPPVDSDALCIAVEQAVLAKLANDWQAIS